MINPTLVFWIVFVLLSLIILWLTLKFNLLSDQSTAAQKPYSYGRVQLAWWTLIIITAFITIFIVKGNLPTLDNSLVILLGISVTTTATAGLIDISAQKNTAGANIIQNQPSEGFLLDILSDGNGVSIHRLQAVLFNLIIGFWVIYSVITHLDCNTENCINTIIPVIDPNKLLLLGVSAATYAGIKVSENKTQ